MTKNLTFLLALISSLAFSSCHKKPKQPDWSDTPISQNQNEPYQPQPYQQYQPRTNYDSGSSWLPWFLLMNHSNNRPSVVYQDAPKQNVTPPSHSYSPQPSYSPPSGSKSYSSHGTSYSAPKASPSSIRSYSSGGSSYSSPSRSYSSPSRSYSSPSRSSGSSRSYSSGGRSYSRGR